MKNTKDKTSDSRKKCKHIDDSERQIIEKLYRKGQSVAQIADLLGFHRSTIYRELQRGRVIHLNSQLEEGESINQEAMDELKAYFSSTCTAKLNPFSIDSIIGLDDALGGIYSRLVGEGALAKVIDDSKFENFNSAQF